MEKIKLKLIFDVKIIKLQTNKYDSKFSLYFQYHMHVFAFF